MPKVGVGIVRHWRTGFRVFRFQSIYAQSGRWNCWFITLRGVGLPVSIHLCPKWALELIEWLCQRFSIYCFNPSMPKVGVGIANVRIIRANELAFQSIYAQSGRWNNIPRRGVCILLRMSTSKCREWVPLVDKYLARFTKIIMDW